ncbi:MAG: hypothetical protein SOI44_01060 [Lactimicrobium sp.]|jgi:protein-S-isoprenylcysteine O-methyltransferase Ste14|uniref:hypothetical protein n=1 Tax=Lactimicrobium sp. TaxID=2563780 RepID=UPI002F35CE49
MVVGVLVLVIACILLYDIHTGLFMAEKHKEETAEEKKERILRIKVVAFDSVSVVFVLYLVYNIVAGLLFPAQAAEYQVSVSNAGLLMCLACGVYALLWYRQRRKGSF